MLGGGFPKNTPPGSQLSLLVIAFMAYEDILLQDDEETDEDGDTDTDTDDDSDGLGDDDENSLKEDEE